MNKCTKKRYETKKYAKQYLKKLQKSNSLSKNVTCVYFCHDCQCYHLTSMGKKKSRRMTRSIKNDE